MNAAFPGADQTAQPPGTLKTSSMASLALVSGVLSFFCFFGIGGALAIAFGWMAHTEIERSGGRLSGKGFANTGIGLGIVNIVGSVVGLGVLIALAVRPDPARAPAPVAAPALTAPTRAPVSVPELAPPSPDPAPAAPLGAAGPEQVPPALPALAPHIGKIAIVETVESDALDRQLLTQLAETSRSGERLVLWTVTPGCEPCAAVGRALSDQRMQRALAGVRLVRTDASSFTQELIQLGVPVKSVPGFTLLDARGRPLDHIHGGEWDDDIPANIAPILDKFVRHTLSARRYRWARPLRDGETPL